jgi:hypothetical protein
MQVLTKELDTKLTRVMTLEEEVKVKERKILDREEDILAIENIVLAKINKLSRDADAATENTTKPEAS